MIPKYTVEYAANFRRHTQDHRYDTDDPIACEDFVQELLEREMPIRAIKHEGVVMPQVDSDRIIKSAAGTLAAKRICASLNLKPEEEKFRFGFAS